jgi:hypothetical protein
LFRDAVKNRLDEYKDMHWETPVSCRSGSFEAKAWCDETKTRITGLQLQFTPAGGDSGEKITHGGNK